MTRTQQNHGIISSLKIQFVWDVGGDGAIKSNSQPRLLLGSPIVIPPTGSLSRGGSEKARLKSMRTCILESADRETWMPFLLINFPAPRSRIIKPLPLNTSMEYVTRSSGGGLRLPTTTSTSSPEWLLPHTSQSTLTLLNPCFSTPTMPGSGPKENEGYRIVNPGASRGSMGSMSRGARPPTPIHNADCMSLAYIKASLSMYCGGAFNRTCVPAKYCDFERRKIDNRSIWSIVSCRGRIFATTLVVFSSVICSATTCFSSTRFVEYNSSSWFSSPMRARSSCFDRSLDSAASFRASPASLFNLADSRKESGSNANSIVTPIATMHTKTRSRKCFLFSNALDSSSFNGGFWKTSISSPMHPIATSRSARISEQANNGNPSKKENINGIVHIACVCIIMLTAGITGIVVIVKRLWELHKIKE